ncbi:prostatic acid phosphatase [Topomyia yanbarensis]|uniref:prostatic acid phosphatase n=1 Tax=Topomyia yanbarensis TaxID=2498891 RepID=UPI00273CBB04|nr:prostatic acid phosphatase [Topomyia yanbarensis]XP_058812427.1 prostatic acid phosphatase [Topomyia yanbarensis]XP_058812428.1 prostatic acid phosphatase [Topomyia yanbarensis]
MILSAFFVILLHTLCIRSQQEFQDAKLIFAHVLYRHGDRTPIDPYPKDPWKDPSHWTTGWGQLTNAGKHRHLELGRWLRNRYHNLLGGTYTNNEIYVRSTDVDRTLMSAESNLAGLYPPNGSDVWDSAIQWQPIPVHTSPEILDEVLAAKKPCPAYDNALRKYKDSDEFQQYNKSLEPVYQYVSTHSGKKVNTPTAAQNLYSCLHIEALNNFTLPDWTKQVYPQPLSSISARSFATKTYTPQLARLKTGPLVKEILQRFQDKANKKLKPDRKLWIYSAHDITVANLLNTLRLFELHNPPFASCVLLELRQSAHYDEPYISIYYKNTTDEPEPMNIPSCGPRCPLSQMFKIYQDILPDNWPRECQVPFLSLTYVEADMRSSTGLIGIIFLTTMAILLLLLVLMAYRRRRSGYHNDQWYLRIDG